MCVGLNFEYYNAQCYRNVNLDDESEPAMYSVMWGHARSPGAARWSRRRDDGGRGWGGGNASDTTNGVCGDSNGFVPTKELSSQYNF